MTGIEASLAEAVEALAHDCAETIELCEKALGDAARARELVVAKTECEIALERVHALVHIAADAADLAKDILGRDL